MKATFHEKDSRTTTILERIHTDVCGPFSVASTAKHRYYVIFFYDFYRKCWIFFMQKKSETYSKFCEFKALVEKESLLGATMVVNSSLENSRTFAAQKEFEESS